VKSYQSGLAADDVFSFMEENASCDLDSRMLNRVVRVLLEKHEIVRVQNYHNVVDQSLLKQRDMSGALKVSLKSIILLQ
jgi:hypothetical protein